MRPAYYNEFDPFAAQWLRNLIAKGLIPAGDVDDRSIVDVRPADLAGYGQCHFFAGIGGFAYACRLAGWPDDRPIWTGGFPCQPFSVAGRQLAQQDDRHLWPVLHGLIEQGRPPVFLGENVAGIIPLALDGVLFDLESSGYASRAFVVPACAVDAPHRRDRVWIAARNLADAACELRDRSGQDAEGRGSEPAIHCGPVEHAAGERRGEGRAEPILRGGRTAAAGAGGPDSAHVADADEPGSQGRNGAERGRGGERSAWADGVAVPGADGKARRVEPGLRLLAHGVPGRVGRLRAYGNAIVPQVAAEIIRGLMVA